MASNPISENPRHSAAKSGRGGKRPGAGAPAGNMNAMKHGAYSKQFAQVGALLASDPTIREALIALARKHNLKRQRANEVAALLFTRLFQRAEDIAAGNQSDHPVGALLAAPEGVRESGLRLNLTLPADDRDSIKLAALQAARRQLQSALRQATKNRKTPRVNQTPDTTAAGQSTPPRPRTGEGAGG
jgi:hypothetical protein